MISKIPSTYCSAGCVGSGDGITVGNGVDGNGAADDDADVNVLVAVSSASGFAFIGDGFASSVLADVVSMDGGFTDDGLLEAGFAVRGFFSVRGLTTGASTETTEGADEINSISSAFLYFVMLLIPSDFARSRNSSNDNSDRFI